MEEYEEKLTPEMMQEMNEHEENQKEDAVDENFINQSEFPSGYGTPEPEPTYNQHSFISASLKEPMPEKVTYLEKGELGIPAFTIRFMQDMEDIAKYYLDPIVNKYFKDKQENRCADYFRQKIINVCDSGMSNNGFIHSMNVTKKMDMQRSRVNTIDNLKGGKKR